MAEIIEVSVGNKKKYCEEKKSYNISSKQLSYLNTSTFSVVIYADTVICALVRSFASNNNERWMEHITSYWRSIKFNQFIAWVRNIYYNKKRYALNFQSFQRCIYPVEHIWSSAFVKIALGFNPGSKTQK